MLLLYVCVEEKQLADVQQQEIEQLQRKVSELQVELKHSKSVDSDAHVSIILKQHWGSAVLEAVFYLLPAVRLIILSK